VSQIYHFPQVTPPKPVYDSPVFHTFYMPRPTHSSRFQNRNNIWWAIQTTKPFIMQLPTIPYYHVPHKPKYFPQYPILRHPQPTFLPQNERPSFMRKKKATRKIIILCVLIFKFLYQLETNHSTPNDSKHCLILIRP